MNNDDFSLLCNVSFLAVDMDVFRSRTNQVVWNHMKFIDMLPHIYGMRAILFSWFLLLL